LEINKNQFEYITDILNYLSNRGLKFIIFLDDLSFEQYEPSYKNLKSALEGGADKKPNNAIFYATSNRRHILSEKWQDKTANYEGEELHGTDAVNEKLSLSDRFGISLTFSKPTPNEYIDIALKLADIEHINMPSEILIKRARKWEANQKGLSGRTARQFIDQLKIEEKLGHSENND
jgi:predicted AAA+ superfamily ATPase